MVDLLQSYPLSRDAETNEQTGYKYIHYGDIHRGKLSIIKSQDILPNIQKGDFTTLQKGDVIVADVSEDYIGIANPCVIDCNINDFLVAGLHTIAVRPKEIDPIFMFYLLFTDNFKNYGRTVGTGTKVFGITAKNFLNFEYVFPTLAEQTTIGNFFKQLDETIALHQRQTEKYQKLRIGFLENIFCTNLSPNNPKKTNAWEQRKLGEIGIATSGTSLESEFSNNGKYKVINIGSYGENSVYIDQGIRTALTEKAAKRILNKNDLTMILNDKTSSGNIIGRVLLIDADCCYVYNQRTQRIEPFLDKFDPQFLYQLLNADHIRKKIYLASQGNTQIYVNWSNIQNIIYLIPKSIEEQTTIGNFFKQLDETIALHQRKIEKYQFIKQLYLEKMFIK